VSENRPQINKKRLGFRLRFALPFVEEPCPLGLQTVFVTHKPSLKRSTDFDKAKHACFRFNSLVCSPSSFRGFGDSFAAELKIYIFLSV
jgi:hypothetical protein